jgi:hypothetical protein
MLSIARGQARGAPAKLLRLFEADPDLLREVPEDEAEVARRRVVVEVVSFAGSLACDAPDRGFLVVEGAIVRRHEAYGHAAVELLAGGDVVRWSELAPATDDSGPHVVSSARGRVTLALLDRQLETQLARWPGVLGMLCERYAARCQALLQLLAIARIRNLDDRMLTLLWALAERWGTVGHEGVTLHLPLSQGLLAELACARRPSVNTALRRLREGGAVRFRHDGRIVLVEPALPVPAAPG